ncbi:MAG: LytTR family DNA-binding domain-containing protein [Tannerella sp.]|jgi:DNA-binding LytR/AlgR family response regulator|nr:LytTR family DNA-binding domain-containing protein [Tannerella sp.]
MRVLIVEDETVAYENLVDIIAEINPSIEIVGNTESISQTINWLQNNSAPDIILMDIHLSDGSAFTIFKDITVEIPIIFTTAYDEYAIEAFKVNSIDYLLKPIKIEELKKAFVKFSKLTHAEVIQYLTQMSRLNMPNRYKDKMLVPYRDKLLPVNMKDISCFYTTNKNTCIYLKNGENYTYSKTLEQIITTLDPSDFIRANKQFIIARNSVTNITIWFDNRLLVTLDTEVPERIYISKNKAAEFKAWIINDVR